MTFSESLAERIRQALARRKSVEEMKMFGGVGFLLNSNMVVGVWKESLIVRLGPDAYEECAGRIARQEVRHNGPGHEGLGGVEPKGIEEDDQLSGWIQGAVKFVGKLPKK